VAGVDGCYKLLTDKMTWSGAGLMCKAYNNAHLLIINSEQKQNVISSWTSANTGNS